MARMRANVTLNGTLVPIFFILSSMLSYFLGMLYCDWVQMNTPITDELLEDYLHHACERLNAGKDPLPYIPVAVHQLLIQYGEWRNKHLEDGVSPLCSLKAWKKNTQVLPHPSKRGLLFVQNRDKQAMKPAFSPTHRCKTRTFGDYSKKNEPKTQGTLGRRENNDEGTFTPLAVHQF